MSAVGLAAFIGRRLLALVVLLFVVSFAVFTLLYLTPGSPEQLLLGTQPSTPETLNAIREQYHLNDPFLEQYWIWLVNALQFDFGQSIRTTEPVLGAIQHRVGMTMFLGVYGFVVALLLGVPLGILAALLKRTAVDRGVVGLSIVGVSAPAFATGIFLLYVFAVELPWFPAFGAGSGFSDRLYHLTLPALALAVTGMALILRITRAAMIDVLDQDYIAFARARGISSGRVLVAYGLRNALIPVVTAAGLVFLYMLTGAVLVEVTFALPGVGSLLVDAVLTKDIPMVQGVTMLVAILVVVVNLLTDIIYLFVDPRVRFESGAA